MRENQDIYRNTIKKVGQTNYQSSFTLQNISFFLFLSYSCNAQFKIQNSTACWLIFFDIGDFITRIFYAEEIKSLIR